MAKKKKGSFSSLKKIVCALTDPEFQVAVHHLSFNRKFGNHKNLTLQLAQLVRAKPSISEEKARSTVNPEAKNNAWSTLLIVTKDRLLESMLLDVNVGRNGEWSAPVRKEIELFKSIQAAILLEARGITDVANEIFTKARTVAGQYEIYYLQELAQEQILAQQGHFAGDGKYEEAQLIIEEAVFKRKVRDFALSEFLRMNAEIHKSQDQKKLYNGLKESIFKIEELQARGYSARAAFFCGILQMTVLEIEGKVTEAITLGEQLIVTIQKNPATNMKHWIAMLSGSVSSLFLAKGSFKKGHFYAKKANKNFRMGSASFVQSLELLFFASFYSGDYEQSLLNISTFEKYGPQVVDEFSQQKWVLFKAAYHFCNNEYADSFELASKTKLLKRDRTGWNICRRILEIMILVEKQVKDVADDRIYNLDRYIKRVMTEEAMVTPRNTIILQLLLKISSSGFNYELIWEQEKDMIELLQSNTDASYGWQIFGGELIRFDQWLQSKVNKQEYVLVY